MWFEPPCRVPTQPHRRNRRSGLLLDRIGGRLSQHDMPSIVEPDGASIITRSVYAEANLYSRTFGRFVASDGAARGSPARCRRQAASCSSWPVLPSRTLVQSPPLPARPLVLLVNENRQVPGEPSCGRDRRAVLRSIIFALPWGGGPCGVAGLRRPPSILGAWSPESLRTRHWLSGWPSLRLRAGLLRGPRPWHCQLLGLPRQSPAP